MTVALVKVAVFFALTTCAFIAVALKAEQDENQQ